MRRDWVGADKCHSLGPITVAAVWTCGPVDLWIMQSFSIILAGQLSHMPLS